MKMIDSTIFYNGKFRLSRIKGDNDRILFTMYHEKAAISIKNDFDRNKLIQILESMIWELKVYNKRIGGGELITK